MEKRILAQARRVAAEGGVLERCSDPEDAVRVAMSLQ